MPHSNASAAYPVKRVPEIRQCGRHLRNRKLRLDFLAPLCRSCSVQEPLKGLPKRVPTFINDRERKYTLRVSDQGFAEPFVKDCSSARNSTACVNSADFFGSISSLRAFSAENW